MEHNTTSIASSRIRNDDGDDDDEEDHEDYWASPLVRE